MGLEATVEHAVGRTVGREAGRATVLANCCAAARLLIPPLYNECAASPNSAAWCISSVRICISSGSPEGCSSVVWIEA